MTVVVPPKVMDDGMEVDVRVGVVHALWGHGKETLYPRPSLPGGCMAFLSSFHQQMLTVPGTGVTKVPQICPCLQGVHSWMRLSLVLVVTGGYNKQSSFRLEEVHAHP